MRLNSDKIWQHHQIDGQANFHVETIHDDL